MDVEYIPIWLYRPSTTHARDPEVIIEEKEEEEYYANELKQTLRRQLIEASVAEMKSNPVHLRRFLQDRLRDFEIDSLHREGRSVGDVKSELNGSHDFWHRSTSRSHPLDKMWRQTRKMWLRQAQHDECMMVEMEEVHRLCFHLGVMSPYEIDIHDIYSAERNSDIEQLLKAINLYDEQHYLLNRTAVEFGLKNDVVDEQTEQEEQQGAVIQEESLHGTPVADDTPTESVSKELFQCEMSSPHAESVSDDKPVSFASTETGLTPRSHGDVRSIGDAVELTTAHDGSLLHAATSGNNDVLFGSGTAGLVESQLTEDPCCGEADVVEEITTTTDNEETSDKFSVKEAESSPAVDNMAVDAVFHSSESTTANTEMMIDDTVSINSIDSHRTDDKLAAETEEPCSVEGKPTANLEDQGTMDDVIDDVIDRPDVIAVTGNEDHHSVDFVDHDTSFDVEESEDTSSSESNIPDTEVQLRESEWVEIDLKAANDVEGMKEDATAFQNNIPDTEVQVQESEWVEIDLNDDDDDANHPSDVSPVAAGPSHEGSAIKKPSLVRRFGRAVAAFFRRRCVCGAKEMPPDNDED